MTPSLTPTRSFSYTATFTPTPSITLSWTVTPSFSVSPTRSPTSDHFYQQDRLIQVRGLYPNPFKDVLRVYYTLRVDAAVKLAIYNVAGEPIDTVAVAGKAGKNEVVWPGINSSGGRCASGTYILRLVADGVDGTEDAFWERAAAVR